MSRVMASADVKKVLQLKLQLKDSTKGHKLAKILKKLQELDITLEILSETGIGKVVNSFRKHEDVGEVAKTLVHRWKKLVPNPSVTQQCPSSPKEPTKNDVQPAEEEEKSQASQNICSERKSKNENSGSDRKLSKNDNGKSKVKPITNKLKTCIDNKDCTKKDLHAMQMDKGKRKSSDGISECRTKVSPKGKNGSFQESELREEKRGKNDEEKADEMDKDLESEDFEMPSMSFEEYLSYDLEAPKRKKRSCESKTPKRVKADQKQDVKTCESGIKTGKPITEVPATVVSKRCVMDLLSVPLPTISPVCEDPSQYQYFTEKKVEESVAEVCEEAPVFTGQRLNKKMQVYSGTKAVYLPTMMTLYQQCIRTLQNNIDSLYEIGGVPFEILEPVLERCTPEQLLRIEEYNPVYIGVTDHLWERHCLRDFRNAQLEEYESWREMYLRLFEERERRFQEITKSITSAHSGKPKGRQVKMAFIHSTAKPPRNVRIQQELHGTAGPWLPQAADNKLGLRNTEGRSKPASTEQPKPFNTGSGNNQPQDPRKIRRVAPMMAKSLKAFKKQLGRR